MRWLCLLLLAASCGAREVAITIDDLPRGGDGIEDAEATRQMTAKLLEPFKRARIPVTGFVNECRSGVDIESILRIWKAARAEMGNHTCSHLDLNKTPIADYLADIAKGEPITTRVFGRRAKYFRHPFLHAGKDAPTKEALNSYLHEHGYVIAPVTLDNADYMFARAYTTSGSPEQARRVRDEYLAYMDSIFDFFEKRAVEVTGHDLRQILLIHANQLNADAMPDLLALMKRRGYTIVTLERALEDEAYSLPESYVGPNGFSWIHRWSKTKGIPPKGEPDEPTWIREAFTSKQ